MTLATLTASFWGKVRITPGCWEWTAARNQAGRGILNPRLCRKNGLSPLAYRISWLIHFGPIPSGLHVLHSCDNPGCVNPNHLFLGSPLDNTLDMMRKRRGGKSKLSEDQVRMIRGDQRPRRVIAKEYGVSLNQVQKIKSGYSWSWIDE